ncbi:hypothetical protein B0T26DRAFT_700628 [Lasiosphaeria miniovina]|uniref:Secreted protein n=1 Tax=Lasiosphaeria miniovina TaxID=1954250 RepID=A0AA40ATV0_9PEZI|nr:uncharacterized protein B0T26DRAFT_700628 [Lasiosphaeria miniovina]KAK0721900.1 hypothetical protein B0T26DRAFT_700628 [Lasiosphaeria miniovina]
MHVGSHSSPRDILAILAVWALWAVVQGRLRGQSLVPGQGVKLRALMRVPPTFSYHPPVGPWQLPTQGRLFVL